MKTKQSKTIYKNKILQNQDEDINGLIQNFDNTVIGSASITSSSKDLKNRIQKQKQQTEKSLSESKLTGILVVDNLEINSTNDQVLSGQDEDEDFQPLVDKNLDNSDSNLSSHDEEEELSANEFSDDASEEKIVIDETKHSKKVIMDQIGKHEISLQNHERQIGQYVLGKTIGEGTFGKVKIGLHVLTKAKVAVKILEKSKIVDVADVERVSREIHILKIVQHPHVVQLYEIIETPKKLYLIMEFASGGELFDYIVKHQRVQEKEACRFFQQLLSGIEYISKLNIVHRDLKPENLLLDFDKGIKIVDFGLSNTYKTGELLKTACGSPCYAAPEMIAGKRYNGTNVDIWSCGVILFALICGYLPFEDPNTSNLYKKILSADFQTPNYVSDEAKDLFHCILNTDPEKRYNIDQIRKHPWFNLVPQEKEIQQAGFIIGIDQFQIDEEIIQKIKFDFGIDPSFTQKCLLANKHNQVTATYYLIVKDDLKKKHQQVTNNNQEIVQKNLQSQTAKEPFDNIRKIQLNQSEIQNRNKKLQPQSIFSGQGMLSKLENASCILDENGKREEEHFQTQEDLQEIEDLQMMDEEEGFSKQPQAKNQLKIQLIQKDQNIIKNHRKIAEGLFKFERYVDKKKQLEKLSDDEQIKFYKSPTEENHMASDFVRRGISPEDPQLRGLSVVLSESTVNDYREQENREQSPGLSPHALRVNALRGNGMQTQFGNFLYQAQSKQFPQLVNQNLTKPKKQQFIVLKQKKQIVVGETGGNMTAKAMQKQLKQLQQRKVGQTPVLTVNPASTLLVSPQGNRDQQKQRPQVWPGPSGGTGNDQRQTNSQQIHLHHQNYKAALKGGGGIGGTITTHSTIQTGLDTLQYQGSVGVPFAQGKQNLSISNIQNSQQEFLKRGGSISKGINPAVKKSNQKSNGQQRPFNTIQQNMSASKQAKANNGNDSKNTNIRFLGDTDMKYKIKASDDNEYIKQAEVVASGQSLKIQTNASQQMRKTSRTGQKAKIPVQRIVPPIFSPKNIPSNSFGLQYQQNPMNVMTPQAVRNQQPLVPQKQFSQNIDPQIYAQLLNVKQNSNFNQPKVNKGYPYYAQGTINIQQQNIINPQIQLQNQEKVINSDEFAEFLLNNVQNQIPRDKIQFNTIQHTRFYNENQYKQQTQQIFSNQNEAQQLKNLGDSKIKNSQNIRPAHQTSLRVSASTAERARQSSKKLMGIIRQKPMSTIEQFEQIAKKKIKKKITNVGSQAFEKKLSRNFEKQMKASSASNNNDGNSYNVKRGSTQGYVTQLVHSPNANIPLRGPGLFQGYLSNMAHCYNDNLSKQVNAHNQISPNHQNENAYSQFKQEFPELPFSEQSFATNQINTQQKMVNLRKAAQSQSPKKSFTVATPFLNNIEPGFEQFDVAQSALLKRMQQNTVNFEQNTKAAVKAQLMKGCEITNMPNRALVPNFNANPQSIQLFVDQNQSSELNRSSFSIRQQCAKQTQKVRGQSINTILTPTNVDIRTVGAFSPAAQVNQIRTVKNQKGQLDIQNIRSGPGQRKNLLSGGIEIVQEQANFKKKRAPIQKQQVPEIQTSFNTGKVYSNDSIERNYDLNDTHLDSQLNDILNCSIYESKHKH